ncbi:MAG TPA: lipoyl synthase [Nitrospirota bacterium]|nr:lipoyl synthase [Nitrospirota bacterium]
MIPNVGDEEINKKARLPPWFKIRLTVNDRSAKVRDLIKSNKLQTVCRSAVCPNQAECWNSGTATFLILGNVCTRGCKFCNVPKGIPEDIDSDEPNRVASAVKSLQLKYAVITSVTRDDLSDGGASFFARTITAIHENVPGCCVEVLVPDFQGSHSSLNTVIDASPNILNHNLETVPSQYPRVRPQADYYRSLELLDRARLSGIVTKSGLMLGFGEKIDEIRAVLRDLSNVACSILTIGQYLQPGRYHLPVVKYYHPDEFMSLRDEAMKMGFNQVVSGPLVRSSYHAEEYGR